MKHLDKIFAAIGMAALVFFIVWMTRNCSHRTKSTEILKIDSLKIYAEQREKIQKQLDSAEAIQFGLDSNVANILRDSVKVDSLRAVYRKAIIDSIVAREVRQSTGR